jgi:hypothetical protein
MDIFVGVPADLKSKLHLGSAVRLTFAMATWAAIAVHTFGVELYVCCLQLECVTIYALIFMIVTQLHLTPKESERLRIISYYKQQSMKLANPGSAGITSDRWGDGLPWKKVKD